MFRPREALAEANHVSEPAIELNTFYALHRRIGMLKETTLWKGQKFPDPVKQSKTLVTQLSSTARTKKTLEAELQGLEKNRQ